MAYWCQAGLGALNLDGEEAISLLTRLVEGGFGRRLRHVGKSDVLEVARGEGGVVRARWLPAAEARPILAAFTSGISIAYEDVLALDGFPSVLVPNWDEEDVEIDRGAGESAWLVGGIGPLREVVLEEIQDAELLADEDPAEAEVAAARVASFRELLSLFDRAEAHGVVLSAAG